MNERAAKGRAAMSDNLIEQARVESVSFNTTDKGRTLFAKLADELARLTAEGKELRAFHDQKATEWLAREDENIAKVCAALDARDRAETELADARRRLALAEAYLNAEDAFAFIEEQCGMGEANGLDVARAAAKCSEAREAFRASLAPAGGKGEGNE